MSYQPTGYHRGGGNTLPFDADRIDSRNGVDRTPVIGRIDLGDLNPYLAELIDALVMQIQNNAERSPLRVFAFNLWSENRYNNPQFQDLLLVYASHVDAICLTQNADPIAVIEGEAGGFMTAACAQLVQQFPALAEYLPPDAEPAIRAGINDWAGIVRDIRAIQQRHHGGGNYNQAYGRQATTQPGSYGRAMPVGTNAPRAYGGGAVSGRAGGNYVPATDLRPSWEREAPARAADPVSPRTGFNGGYTRTSAGSPAKDPIQAAPPPPAAARGNRYATTNGTTTANPNRPLDRIELKDGRVIVPAFLAKTPVPYTCEQPPQVYNRHTHFLFHVIYPDGRVEETIQEKNDNMEYLEHELDERLKKIHKVNTGLFAKERVDTTIIEARKLVPNQSGRIATLVTPEKREELDRMNAPRQLTHPFIAASLKDALFQARMEAARSEESTRFLEFQVEQTTDYAFKDKQLEPVLTLRRCDNYGKFLTTLGELASSGVISPEFHETLDTRATVAFNRYIRKQMYLEWTVDSISEDFHDLMKEVEAKKGAAIATKVLESAPMVIARAMSVLTGEALSEFLKRIPDADRKLIHEPAIFCDRYSVTQLPWSLYEMEHNWRLEGIVTRENAEAFHEALDMIFSRTRTNGCHEHILLTRDEHVIWTYRSAIVSSNFTVTREHPVHLTQFLEDG